jgi:hypothetical protein
LLCLLLALVASRMALAADAAIEALLRQSLGQRHWYGLYLMDKKAGYASSRVLERTVDGRDAVEFRLDARLKVTTLGQEQDTRLVERRVYFRDTGRLHSIQNRFQTQASDVAIRAEVKGETLVVTARTGALVNRKEFPVPRENLRSALAANGLLLPGAEVGDQVTFHQFEPMMLKETKAVCTLSERKHIIFNGVRTAVAVIELRLADLGITSELIVDDRGVALEMQMGGAFTLRLEPEQQAKDVTASADLVRLGCIRLQPPPKHPSALREFRLRFEGVPEDAELINDARQQWTQQPDGSYLLAARVPKFEPDAAPDRPVRTEALAEHLRPSVFIQSDHERIRALAAEIVGDERNAYRAARKLAKWVHANLRKVGTAALSNAVETLEAGQGDCTEHTVLFLALCRAAGIPGREVSGVTATERGQGLYFHAWAEVWAGQWVAIDPTLDQAIADATHIKFAQGAVDQQFRIVSFIGTLKATIVDHGDGNGN